MATKKRNATELKAPSGHPATVITEPETVPVIADPKPLTGPPIVPGEMVVTDPLQQLERHRQLEIGVAQGKLQSAQCLRAIVEERTYRSEGYDRLDDYMNIRWATTAKSAYAAITWLNALEFLDSKGVTDPLQNLKKEAALVFRRWQNRPEIFYLAYQQVVERGEEPTQERLENEANVQQDFLIEADRTPDVTQEEYRAYQRLAALPCAYEFEPEQAPGQNSADDLLDRCRKLKKKPPLKLVLSVARGPALLTFVQQLEPVSAEVASLKQLKQKKAELERQKREQIKRLQEELHNIQEEITKSEGNLSDEDENDDDEDQGPTTLRLVEPSPTTTECEQPSEGERLVEIVFSVYGRFKLKEPDAILEKIKDEEIDVAFLLGPTESKVTLKMESGDLVSEKAEWDVERLEPASDDGDDLNQFEPENLT